MPLKLTCRCGQSYLVRNEFAGHTVQCPGCATTLTVPGIKAEPEHEPEPVVHRAGRFLFFILCLLFLSGVGVAGYLVWKKKQQGIQAPTHLVAKADTHPIKKPKPRPEEKKPEEKKPEEKKPDEKKPDEKKPDEKKPDEKKPDEKKPAPKALNKDRILAIQHLEDGRIVTIRPDSIVVKKGESAKHTMGFQYGISAGAVSPDGKRAVIARAELSKFPKDQLDLAYALEVWDLDNGLLLDLLRGHTAEVLSIVFSPDGKQVASAGKDPIIRVWNVATRRIDIALAMDKGPTNQIAFSPDGKSLFSGGGDFHARQWGLKLGDEKRVFFGHKDVIWAVAISPDGKILATGAGNHYGDKGLAPGTLDFTIRLWNVETGKEIRQLGTHKKRIVALAFSPHGDRLLSATEDKIVQCWDVESGKEVKKLPDHSEEVHAVAFVNEGREALTVTDLKSQQFPLPSSVFHAIADLKKSGGRIPLLRQLEEAGARASSGLPLILTLWPSESESYRKAALKTLKSIGKPSAKEVKLLLPLLKDRAFLPGRLYALENLNALGEDSLPALDLLIAGLSDTEVDIRRMSAQTIGSIGESAKAKAWTHLVDRLQDKDEKVSEAALASLKQMGELSDKDLPQLMKYLEAKHVSIRSFALDCLDALKAVAKPAGALLVKRITAEEDGLLRKKAIELSMRLAPDHEQLAPALSSRVEDLDARVSLTAMQSLVKLGIERGTLPALLKCLDHTTVAVQNLAREGLQTAKLNQSHVPLLIKAFVEVSQSARMRLIQSLGKMGEDAEAAVKTLADALVAAGAEEQRAIVKVLKGLGMKAAAAGPNLVGLLESRDRRVRREVSLTLIQINAKEVDQVIPILVKDLYIEDPNDEALAEQREECGKALIDLGKRAVPSLVEAFKTFGGVGKTREEALLRAAARHTVINILVKMGGKVAGSNNVLRALIQVERRDPYRPLRKVAHQAYVQLQKKD